MCGRKNDVNAAGKTTLMQRAKRRQCGGGTEAVQRRNGRVGDITVGEVGDVAVEDLGMLQWGLP
jgi:hypothetical protein